jgi:hypothetical protein
MSACGDCFAEQALTRNKPHVVRVTKTPSGYQAHPANIRLLRLFSFSGIACRGFKLEEPGEFAADLQACRII